MKSIANKGFDRIKHGVEFSGLTNNVSIACRNTTPLRKKMQELLALYFMFVGKVTCQYKRHRELSGGTLHLTFFYQTAKIFEIQSVP